MSYTTDIILSDSAQADWALSVNPDGSLNTQPGTGTPTTLTLFDILGRQWSIYPNTDGSLTTDLVSGQSPSIPTIAAGDIISSVIQDTQQGTTNRVALLDYVDRVSQRILRDTQWLFLRSRPMRFITHPSGVEYYIGSGSAPTSSVINTALGLSDVNSIWVESVFNASDGTQLMMDSDVQMQGHLLRQRDATFRTGYPASFRYETANPYVIQILPAADTNNSYQPVPLSPNCIAVPGGNLPARTYYVGATLVDSEGKESTISNLPSQIYVPANYLLVASNPALEVSSSLNVQYSYWNCYVGTTPTNMTLQSNVPLAGTVSPNFPSFSGSQKVSIFTDSNNQDWALTINPDGSLGTSTTTFTEPFTGIQTGIAPPTTNGITPLYGYVIEFRYFQQRKIIRSATDILQIPAVYRDVVISGVNYYASMYLERGEERNSKVMFWKAEFLDGIKQMRKDLNLNFRSTDFIAPDRSSQYKPTLTYGITQYF